MKNTIWIHCSILLLLFTTSCNQEKYTVMFEVDGGSQIGDMKVSPGTKLLTLPEPTKENYSFGGWYVDAKCKYRFDNYSRLVNTDIVLYAKWIVSNEPDNKDAHILRLRSILESTALMPYLECTIDKTIEQCSTTQKSTTHIQYDRINKKIFFTANSNSTDNSTDEIYYFDGRQADIAYIYSKDSKSQLKFQYRYSCSLDCIYGLSGLKQILDTSIIHSLKEVKELIVPLDENSYQIEVYDLTTYKYTIKINEKQNLEMMNFKKISNGVSILDITWNFSYNTRPINFPSGYTFSDFENINSRRVILSYPSGESYPINQQSTLYITPRKGGFYRLKQEEAEKFSPIFFTTTTNYSYYRYKYPITPPPLNEDNNDVFKDCKDYIVEYDQDVLYAR